MISLSPSKINRDSSTSLHSLLCCLSKQDSRHRKGDLKSLMLRNEYSGSCILIPYFIIIIAKTTQKLKSNESVYKCRLHCIWLNGPAATSRSFNNATATINKTKYFHNISDKVSWSSMIRFRRFLPASADEWIKHGTMKVRCSMFSNCICI